MRAAWWSQQRQPRPRCRPRHSATAASRRASPSHAAARARRSWCMPRRRVPVRQKERAMISTRCARRHARKTAPAVRSPQCVSAASFFCSPGEGRGEGGGGARGEGRGEGGIRIRVRVRVRVRVKFRVGLRVRVRVSVRVRGQGQGQGQG